MKSAVICSSLRPTFRHNAALVAVAMGLATLMSACGDDVGSAGPVVVESDGGVGGGDALGAAADGVATGDGAAIAAADGVDPGGDASAGPVDGAVGSDGGPGTVDPAKSCTGKCGNYDAKALCQCDSKCVSKGDCCSDYQAVCSGVSPPVCGDGKCQPPENQASCPGDCGTPPPGSCAGKCGQYDKSWTCQCDTQCGQKGDCCGDLAAACPGSTGGGSAITTCIENNCKAEVATCLADPPCAKILDCAKNCSDQNCLFGCTGGAGGIGNLPPGLTPIYNCGNKANCFQGGGGGPTCGDGTCSGGENATTCPKDCGATTPPVCGDGTCSPGETATSCAKDCANTTTPTADQCMQTNCSKQYASCAGNTACMAGLACVEGGKQIWECVTDWQVGLMLGQLTGCGAQYKCLSGGGVIPGGGGGGGGGGGTPPAGSCAGKCGQINNWNECQCATWCSQAGNCCSDYKTVCP